VLRIVITCLVSSIAVLSKGQVEFEFLLPLNPQEAITYTSFLNEAVVVSQADQYSKAESKPQRRYVVLDSNLNLLFDIVPLAPFRQKLVSSWNDDTAQYDLFYDYRRGDFHLTTVTKHGLTTHVGRLPTKLYDLQFRVIHDKMYVLTLKRKREQVIVYDKNSNDVNVVSIKSKLKRGKINFVSWSISGSEQHALFWNDFTRSQNLNMVLAFDGDDHELFELRCSDNSILQSIKAKATEEGSMVVLGSYGQRQEGESAGIKSFHVQDGSVVQQHSYSFSEMSHFFDFLSEADQETIKRRLARLKRHEKSTDVYYWTELEFVGKTDNEIYLVSSNYNKQYQDLYGVTRDGNNIAGSPTELRGFTHSHASILRFDQEGEYLHDDMVRLDSSILNRFTASGAHWMVEDTVFRGLYLRSDALNSVVVKPHHPPLTESDKEVFTTSDQRVVSARRIGRYDTANYFMHGYLTTAPSGEKVKGRIYFIEKRKLR